MAAELLKRSQVPKEDTWATEELYASIELFLEDARRLEQMEIGRASCRERVSWYV